MATIALLGTGLLGAAMAENLLQKGHTVRVWNRTAAKAAALADRGAIVAADPAAAVRGADRVHLVLSEDRAVDAVVDALRPGLAAGVPVLDHSTNLPRLVLDRCQRLHAAQVRYLPAPVFMSPDNAREASGLMLLAGSEQDHAQLAPELGAMTGKVFYTGTRLDLPAVYKLAGNSLFFALTGAMADVLAIGRGQGVDAETMLALFAVFKPGAALPWIGQRVERAGEGKASFELAMARKDARLMLETAGDHATTLLPAIVAAMDRGIAAGRAGDDYAAFVRCTGR
jgi:3-hydroxyisobutyrate dehydrogenase